MQPSCDPSSTCRIDWTPSRLAVAALIVLAILAPLSLALSALPGWLSLPAGLLSAGRGLWLAHREAHRPALYITWNGGDAPACVGQGAAEECWHDVRVSLRGPMAALCGRDACGRRHRLVWWPDTLPVAARRQLRLTSQVSRRSGKPLREMAA